MLRLFSTTALLIGLSVSVAQSQSLRDADEPAEFPPSSFTGKQYVDSRGCVYVRAGFDGNVTWVPRVNRQRSVLCGFQPTFAEAPRPVVPVIPDSTQVATAPPPQTPERVAPVTPRSTESARPTPPPTTTPAPTRVVKAPVVRTPPPAHVKPVPSQPVVVQRPPQVASAGGCPGASALSQQYLNSTRSVRCGPQGVHPGTYATRTDGGGTSVPAGVLRVAPAPEIAPPPGYKAAFEDDRFNPNRGKQTREGFAQMRLVWTAGVPRRLVDQTSGRDVTSLFPGLKFPFISYKQQKRYVAANGWPAASGGVTVATKNTPATAVVPRATSGSTSPSGHRYVQVGAFGAPSNADRAAARLRQVGLPVRLGTYKKSGKTYRVVLAGPFTSGAALNNALTAARRAGFSDAFTRK